MRDSVPKARRKRVQWLFTALLGAVVALGAVACGERGAEPEPPPVPPLKRAVSFEDDLLPLVQVQGETYTPWTLQERMEHYRSPGMSVAVLREGEIAWSRGYGQVLGGLGEAELDSAEPVGPETLFAAGPFAMSVTSVAAVRLAERGPLDLDAAIGKWRSLTLDEPITLRQLLNHIGGVGPAELERARAAAPMASLTDLLLGRSGAEGQALEILYRPGLRFAYSEAGYALVELALTEAGDGDFGALMNELVLAPLAMNRSRFDPSPPEGPFAHPHDPLGQPIVDFGRAPSLAADGLWTTASDFARLMLALQRSLDPRQEGFLSAESAREVLRRGLNNQGLGFRILTKRGPRRFLVAGSAPGGHVLAWALEDRPEGAVILVNGARAEMLTWEVLQALARQYGWLGLGPTMTDGSDVSTLLPLVGSYQFPSGQRGGGSLQLTMQGTRLSLRASPGVFLGEGEVIADLYPSEGLYVIADRPERLEFSWEGEALASSLFFDGDRAERLQ